MAIQPIDLQTLFTQMDKVARQKSAEKEGLILQQSLQGVVDLKKNEEKVRSVNETKEPEEGVERIKDKNAKKQGHEGTAQKKDEKQEALDEEAVDVIQDPDLGKHIDVSG